MFSSNTTQESDGGYQISRSLRFNSADFAYLQRTPGSAGNRKAYTWSGWVKKGTNGSDLKTLFASYADPNNTAQFAFTDSDTIRFYSINAGTTTVNVITSAVFRDPSAWYHVVLSVNVASTTVNIYVNGVLQSLGTNSVSNVDTNINATVEHNLGRHPFGQYLNGYLTEVNFIDGQALTPSSFGETNAQTGVWQPKAYAGSYGTNGFYVNFSDNSNTTAATLGKDYSGNGNNWTPWNFSVTAGAGNDSLVDTPTPYGVDTGAGGTVRGNYATLNAVRVPSSVTLSNGNLDVSTSNISEGATGTIAVASGKWYWETTFNTQTAGNYLITGIVDSATTTTFPTGSNGFGYYANTGNSYGNGTDKAYGATYTTGDIIGIALDIDNGKVWWSKNGTWQASGDPAAGTNAAYTTNIAGRSWMPSIGTGSGTVTASLNTGQRPFAYTAPSGFKALCTQNLPTPTIGATTATQAGNYFVPTAYTGNGSSSRAISNGINMAANGGLVWTKQRSGVEWHFLIDNVRGNTKYLSSNATNAEGTISTLVTGFDSTGYSIGNDSGINSNGSTYVSWVWGAGGAGVTNTAGSITSTVSANTTSGFSIAKATLPSGVGASYGHGLGIAPAFIFAKCTSTTSDWFVYHQSLGFDKDIRLNTTGAVASTTFTYNSANSTTVTIGGGNVNAYWGANTTWVFYNFAEVPGYSRFGSYTGNGSADGPFVFCGFRPRLVMAKNASNLGSWIVLDTARDPYNIASATLNWNSSGAESPFNSLDIVSNGFKMRNTNSGFNTNGDTYIFVAFAENPFKYSLAR